MHYIPQSTFLCYFTKVLLVCLSKQHLHYSEVPLHLHFFFNKKNKAFFNNKNKAFFNNKNEDFLFKNWRTVLPLSSSLSSSSSSSTSTAFLFWGDAAAFCPPFFPYKIVTQHKITIPILNTIISEYNYWSITCTMYLDLVDLPTSNL